MGDIQIGSTCRLGNGKTLWEVIAVRGDNLTLSALGRAGYVNRSAEAGQVSGVAGPAMEWPLHLLLSERERARTAAWNLHDRLRFTQADDLRALAGRANQAAVSYATVCENHSRELALHGIKEGD